MYDIPYYKETDSGKVLQFMRQHPFAMLIGCNDNRPQATQVPLLIEEREGKTFLKGHIMRNSGHHNALEQNNNVLCVFTGAHAYVSASWYTNPHVASTWNYMSVHATGTLNFPPTENLIEILAQTTALFENKAASAASFERLAPEYVQGLAKAIIGFEVEVTRIDHVFKLSQNRDRESYGNIINNLQSGDARAQGIAAEMQQRQGQLFNGE